jgi:transcriptional regulator of acetoin/glycerol metabolism
MPYVSQTQHVDRVRGVIEGRLPAPANSPRLVSSWQRSYDQYRLDPSSVIGPRVLSSAELREVQGKE